MHPNNMHLPDRSNQAFSIRFPKAVFHKEGRIQKGKKIFAVLSDVLGAELYRCRMLDIGCAAGIISNELASQVGSLFGADVDFDAVHYAAHHRKPNARFLVADAQFLPFSDACMEVVICAHVYEHVENASRLVAEIHRVLKPGGYCFFAAANRLAVIEPHYHLPFLSMLPPFLADAMMKFTGKGSVYREKHLTSGSLRRLLAGFHIFDYTSRIVEDPKKYAAEDVVRPGSLKQAVGRLVCRFAPALAPSFIFMLQKPSDGLRPSFQQVLDGSNTCR